MVGALDRAGNLADHNAMLPPMNWYFVVMATGMPVEWCTEPVTIATLDPVAAMLAFKRRLLRLRR